MGQWVIFPGWGQCSELHAVDVGQPGTVLHRLFQKVFFQNSQRKEISGANQLGQGQPGDGH